MDDQQFDALTRVLSSRRTALTGVVGSLATVLGLSMSERAGAHSFTARCRKLPDPAKRRACVRRARRHDRKHRCKPRSTAVTCGGGCGSALNNCGKRVTCPACAAGKSCLANRSCAQICGQGHPACPTGCGCTFLEAGSGVPYCTAPIIGACAGVRPGVCASTAQCPLNHVCTSVQCGPGETFENRCVALCQA
jgi:hypothetical protein